MSFLIIEALEQWYEFLSIYLYVARSLCKFMYGKFKAHASRNLIYRMIPKKINLFVFSGEIFFDFLFPPETQPERTSSFSKHDLKFFIEIVKKINATFNSIIYRQWNLIIFPSYLF